MKTHYFLQIIFVLVFYKVEVFDWDQNRQKKADITVYFTITTTKYAAPFLNRSYIQDWLLTCDEPVTSQRFFKYVFGHLKKDTCNYECTKHILQACLKPESNRERIAFGPLLITVLYLALKKTGFSEKKNSSQKKKIFYFFSMQLFSGDAMVFSKKF